MKPTNSWMIPKTTNFVIQESLIATCNSYPYELAVEEIQKVVTLYCPLQKLECIGKFGKEGRTRSTRMIVVK